MKTSIFDLLMYSNPQSLADLDSYQKRWYDRGISKPDAALQPAVSLDSRIESEGEISQLMRQPPASPSELRGDE